MKLPRIVLSIAAVVVAAWLAAQASSLALGRDWGQAGMILFLATFALLASLFTKIIYAGRSIDRIWIILVGYAGACFSAGLILTILLWIVMVMWNGQPRVLMAIPFVIVPGTLIAVLHIAVFASLPSCLLIAYAEFANIRSTLFYALAGLVGGQLGCVLYYRGAIHFPELALVAIAGLGGGLTYWRIAGRNAGRVGVQRQEYG